MSGSAGATETIRFPVRGMTCVACRGRITRSLRSLPGVVRVDVDLGAETATVRRETALVSNAALAAAVAAAGYEADLARPEILPDGAGSGLLGRLLGRR
ncbi:MAG TPA: heavy metal-associated domain-containing protein [Candidatus Limnocylindrales bacterium]|nr:heavy metal-associated domain-containing protein [Candidatus Limnocylindrales bacterium]